VTTRTAYTLLWGFGYHPGMSDDTARRRHLVTTAMVGALLPADVPEGQMIRAWLDNWTGIGHVATGMARQGYDLALTSYAGEGWRATFYTMGREHAPTRATRTAWQKTPWRAVQVAALDTLRRIKED
jgi:hypothetical protein